MFLKFTLYLKIVFAVILVNLISSNASAQYCIGSVLGGGNCTSGQLITAVVISGTSLNNPSATCQSVGGSTLTTFPASGNTTATLVQGQNYTLSVTTDADNIVSVWIDYDHNLVYDSTEWTQVCLTSVGGIANFVSFTVPFGSYFGATGMRVRSRQSNVNNGAGDACSQFGSGETEDYTITISAGSPCTAPPTAGITVSSVTNACIGTNFILTLNGNSIGSGMGFQWQASTNGTNWSNLVGANGPNLTSTISVPAYFRCALTCNSVTSYSTPAFVGINPVSQCYCTSSASSNADDDIGNVTFGSLNNGVVGNATNNVTSINTYTDFTNLSPQLFYPGSSYPISVTQINRLGFYACSLAVYIDYNQNGDFDVNSENVFIALSNAAVGGNVMNGSVTIPLNTISGITRMRLVLIEGNNNPMSPCGTYTWGETEDYLINIQQALPCVTPPTAGTAIPSANAVCPNQSVLIQLNGNSVGLGQTYQWEESVNGGLWNNIANATNTTLSASPSQNSSYRCIVFCGGIPDTSNIVSIAINSLANCYCPSSATNTADDDIGNITFGTLNNGVAGAATNNPASVNLYTDYTGLAPQSFIQTFSYPISITQINSGGFYTCWANVFIDYNQDGDFTDADERVFSAASSNTLGGNVIQGNVVIPITALSGNTRMRIVLAESSSALQNPCGTYTWGETEDYTITIVPIAPCTAPPNAGTTVSSISTVCPHEVFSLSLQGNTIGTGLSYQWQISTDGINWNNISGATNANFTTSQLSANYYRCQVVCSSVPSFSVGLLLNMVAGGVSVSTVSGGLIPDNNTSVCFPITVTGLPTQINMSYGLTEVCINIQHPEVGELKIYLKSPSGDSISLSENNGGLFANYNNTCFAMNGANGYIYAANAPFTGTYIPQRSINGFNDGQNPNGTWLLCVKDEAPSVNLPGQFINATLSFCSNPPADPIIVPGGCSGTNAFGCQCPDGTQNCDLLPDMTASALIIQNQHIETLGNMRLSNATPNIGWGPMEIHGSGQCYCDTVSVSCATTICPNGQPVRELVKQTIYHKNQGVMTSYIRDAGYMSYHPTHGHVHVDAWGAFSLRIPTSNPDATTWPIVGTGAKVSFCLINLGNCTNNMGYCVDTLGNVITQANIPNSGFGSVTGCGTDQGIFTGSLDIYSSGLAGMEMNFPGACNGDYAIVSITDPNNDFLEQNENNNWVQVPVTLTQQFPATGVTSFAYNAAGTTVSFTNTTPISTGFLWDFGDGTTDTVANPIHTYATNSAYTVKLVAINQCYTASTQNILITNVKEEENFAFGFSANPNPAKGLVTVSYFLPQKSPINIELYDLVGKQINVLKKETQDKGKYDLVMDTKELGLGAGMYLLKLTVGSSTQTIRLVLID